MILPVDGKTRANVHGSGNLVGRNAGVDAEPHGHADHALAPAETGGSVSGRLRTNSIRPEGLRRALASDADEIAVWLRLIHSCRLILEDVGYDVSTQGPVIHIEVPSMLQVKGPVP